MELIQGGFSKLNGEKQSYLLSLVKKGGPELADYERFTDLVYGLHPSQLEDFRGIIKFALDENTLMGRAYKKLFGYPGDFFLIDLIYKYYCNPDPRYTKWDEYFHKQVGTIAVRNRKEYFLEKIRDLVSRSDKEVKVLILGSGPASDVYDIYKELPDVPLTFDLVDFDQVAIEYSREKNAVNEGKITYNRINALRFKPFQFYDMIWSAGLFDYFKDKHFVFLIKKYINCLMENGEFIIGNFTENPSKVLMANISEWHLNLRSESDLFRLASEAGIHDKLVTIERESLGINLFMRIQSNNK